MPASMCLLRSHVSTDKKNTHMRCYSLSSHVREHGGYPDGRSVPRWHQPLALQHHLGCRSLTIYLSTHTHIHTVICVRICQWCTSGPGDCGCDDCEGVLYDAPNRTDRIQSLPLISSFSLSLSSVSYLFVCMVTVYVSKAVFVAFSDRRQV